MLLQQKCKLHQENKTEQEEPEENISMAKIQKISWKQRICFSISTIWNKICKTTFQLRQLQKAQCCYHTQTSHFPFLWFREDAFKCSKESQEKTEIEHRAKVCNVITVSSESWIRTGPSMHQLQIPKSPRFWPPQTQYIKKSSKIAPFLTECAILMQNSTRKWYNYGFS